MYFIQVVWSIVSVNVITKKLYEVFYHYGKAAVYWRNTSSTSTLISWSNLQFQQHQFPRNGKRTFHSKISYFENNDSCSKTASWCCNIQNKSVHNRLALKMYYAQLLKYLSPVQHFIILQHFSVGQGKMLNNFCIPYV